MLIDPAIACELLARAREVPNGFGSKRFKEWHTGTFNDLSRIYGDGSGPVVRFAAIEWGGFGRGMAEAKGLLESLLREAASLLRAREPAGAHHPPANRREAQMNVSLQQACDMLSRAQDPNEIGRTASDIARWRMRVATDLGTIFGDDSPQVKKFEGISFDIYIDEGSVQIATNRAVGEAVSLLGGLQKRIEFQMQAITTAKQTDTPIPSSTVTTPSVHNRVFVVHGHAHNLKNAVARFIDAVGLDAIVLHERPNQGRTIIEKFENEAARVDLAVVLCTADDLAESAKAAEASGNVDGNISLDRLKDRARQNVIFELGYFVAKLGRGRVVLISDAGVELPSDLAGVIYSARKNWQNELMREMCGTRLYSFTSEQTAKALGIVD